MADNDAWGDSAPADNGRTPSPRRDEPMNGRDDDRQRRRDDASAEVNQGNNLHVGGLDKRTRDSDLEEIFGKFGKILKAQVMRDPHSRESRGFGFVEFEQADDANAAVAALNATTLDERTITVEKAKRGRARTPTPGAYRGPPKRGERDFGGRGGFEPRRDDRRPRYDDRRSYSGYGGYGRDPMAAAPMREDRPPRDYDDRRPLPPRGYDDRPPRGYDDRPPRGYDDRPPRSYDDRPPRGSGYDDRPPRGGSYDDRRPYPPAAMGGAVPAPYDDRRAPPSDYGRRERDYDDRRPRDYPPRGYDEPVRRY